MLQASSLCDFVIKFLLEGNGNNSSQTSQEKRLELLSKETGPYCCYNFIFIHKNSGWMSSFVRGDNSNLAFTREISNSCPLSASFLLALFPL